MLSRYIHSRLSSGQIPDLLSSIFVAAIRRYRRCPWHRQDFNDERRDESSFQTARRFWVEAGWHPPQSDLRQK